jgi:hypothetical protein
MMMTQTEALRLALEALEAITRRNQSDHQAEIAEEAITPIKAALEAKDEPVAEVTSETGAEITMSWWHEPALPIGTKLYTTPPQRTWVGLTDNEVLECLKSVDVATAVNLLMSQYEMPPTFKVYAKAIEAKLKEKNT